MMNLFDHCVLMVF